MSENSTYQYLYNSPIGNLCIETTDNAVTRLDFPCDGTDKHIINLPASKYPKIMNTTVNELDLYFEGRLKNFTVKTKQENTPFRLSVYEELKKIPYGKTISYKELAKNIGNEKAVRAVGGANHNNKISIIIPCHRVIGADGALTGYGGGLERKKALLELERNNC